MIISKFVNVKIAQRNYPRLKDLGYDIKPFNKNISQEIEILVEHLHSGSRTNVLCKCDTCGKKYKQRFNRNTDICGNCRMAANAIGNKWGNVKKGKPNYSQRGDKHPRYNPNMKEIKRYGSQVRSYTKKNFDNEVKKLIGDKKIGRCGVENAYQVDHIISIKNGFYGNIPIEVIGHIDNIQVLSWEENRKKWY